MCQRVVIIKSINMNLGKTHIVVCVNTCFNEKIVLCYTLTTRTNKEDRQNIDRITQFLPPHHKQGNYKTRYRKDSS